MADIMGNISIPGFDANKLKALMEGKGESSAPPGLKPGEKPKPANTGVRKFYHGSPSLLHPSENGQLKISRKSSLE